VIHHFPVRHYVCATVTGVGISGGERRGRLRTPF